MKVLVVGFPKTGTTSMAAALRELGYKVYDFEENYMHLGKRWMEIFTEGGTTEDFYEMYKDVDASADLPVCMFWEEILAAFPDVKLILTRRKSEEEWWASWVQQLQAINSRVIIKLMILLSPTFRAFQDYTEYTKHVVFSGVPGRHRLDYYVGFSPTVSKMRYREHNAAVKIRAPRDQLLEYDLSDGWEPLCKFLCINDVPRTPFPRENVGSTNIQRQLTTEPMFLKVRNEVKYSLAVIVVLLAILAYACFAYLL